MLSIIICSRDTALLKKVTENVSATIGVQYEIITIDNQNNHYSICEAYNKGACNAKYDILCFMHEDIKFHTADWGQKVYSILLDPKIGLLGVAGGVVKTKAPGSWWRPTDKSFTRIHIQQSSPSNSTIFINENPYNEQLSEVVALDGVWLCTRKEVWLKNKFDQKKFKGFHFYDVDFSMQILQNYKVCVTHEILLEHFSHGTINSSWTYNAMEFLIKWKHKLPVSTSPINRNEMKILEYEEHKAFLKTLIHFKFEDKYIFKCALNCLLLNPKDKKSLRIIKNMFKDRIPGIYNLLKKMKTMLVI